VLDGMQTWYRMSLGGSSVQVSGNQIIIYTLPAPLPQVPAMFRKRPEVSMGLAVLGLRRDLFFGQRSVDMTFRDDQAPPVNQFLSSFAALNGTDWRFQSDEDDVPDVSWRLLSGGTATTHQCRVLSGTFEATVDALVSSARKTGHLWVAWRVGVSIP